MSWVINCRKQVISVFLLGRAVWQRDPVRMLLVAFVFLCKNLFEPLHLPCRRAGDSRWERAHSRNMAPSSHLLALSLSAMELSRIAFLRA